jgi:hypothetical protein
MYEGKVHIGVWWRKLRKGVDLEYYTYWWEDNIKIDVEEMGRGDLDWMCMAQVRERWRAVVNAIMNLHIKKKLEGGGLS